MDVSMLSVRERYRVTTVELWQLAVQNLGYKVTCFSEPQLRFVLFAPLNE